MKFYKKIFITLGMTLVVIPQICSALDTEGNAIVTSIKNAYTNAFMPNKILNVSSTELDTWTNAIDEIENYVTKNSSVLGVKDAILIKSLFVLALNNHFVSLIKKAGTASQEMKQGIIKKLETDVISEIVRMETTLKSESYYVTSKKNAKEILLFVLEYMRGAAATAIAQLRK